MKLDHHSSSDAVRNDGMYYTYSLPGLDLPADVRHADLDPQLHAEHTEARVALAGHLTLGHWRKAMTDASCALRAAKADLKRVVKGAKSVRDELADAPRPDLFAIVLATIFGGTALAAEYFLSTTTVGPAFGHEPDSVPGYFLAAIPLVVAAACHKPAARMFSLVRQLNCSTNIFRKSAAIILDIGLAAGIFWANYQMISSLGPLRQQVAIMTSAAAANDNFDTSASAPPQVVDENILRNCVFLLSTVAVLDSLLLLVIVHDEARPLARLFTLRRTLGRMESGRADALRRCRAARQELIHRRFVWRGREERLEAIRTALVKREECLRSPVQTDQTRRAWVNRTLASAGQLRRVG